MQTIHEGKKPYQCEICDRTFSQKSNMVNHKCTEIEVYDTIEDPFDFYSKPETNVAIGSIFLQKLRLSLTCDSDCESLLSQAETIINLL